ncbi:MAG: radical SAM protein [Fimbriimonadaceae bacterium]|nr:radical SAM protein [Fimbriimonadaceae bacterium]
MNLLIHPPLADPTQPYLSLPTLKAYLRSRGLDAQVIDLNVEAAHHVLREESLRQLASLLGERFISFNHQDRLSFAEQREFRAIAECRVGLEDAICGRPTPLEVLRDASLFEDPEHYHRARIRIEAVFQALSAAWHPLRLGFNRFDRDVVPWSFELLEAHADGAAGPFDDLYRRVFDPPEDWNDLANGQLWVDVSEVEFVGISVIFPSQIPEALRLARFLKARAPSAFVCIGGPSIHQSAVHMGPEQRARLLSFVDGVALFEGEALLDSLLRRLESWRSADSPSARFEALRDVPNLLILDPATGVPVVGPRFTLDLRESDPPDYSDLDLDRYLAPSRTLLYAPTRGCYWGKCSFCYYGLTETATAAYREIPPEKAATDLAHLSQRYGVKNFYLSCDVLSPRYAVALANALSERGSNLRWHCDLKIDKYFTEERVDTLFRGGMRAAAFGIESGSNRILDLMRKGCDRETMTSVNRIFSERGIATQWMTFTDHPDESVEEALETVAWIDGETPHVALFLVGEFGLEQGSHIAQDPERYGISQIYFAEGDDLRLYALFRQRGGARSAEDRERVDRAIDRVAARFTSRPYPWAGAISTHHTFLHFLRFGAQAFKSHFKGVATATPSVSREAALTHIAGMRKKPRFSLEAIARTEEQFFSRWLPRALYTTLPSRRGFGQGAVAPLSLEHYQAAIAEIPELRPHE